MEAKAVITNKLISVVVPVYNRELLITRALDSVIAQTYRPLELLVVDDGSTDGTVEAVQSWMDAHPNSDLFSTKLICQEKLGGNAARNRGIEVSSGDFIAFLDSDDSWLADKLRKQVAFFDDPDVGGVYCGVQHVDVVSGQVLEAYRRTYPIGWILDQILIRDVTAPTSAFMLRKDVFDKVGSFDLDLQARQDWDMWIRLASKYKIQAVPELLVRYGEHTGARTASDPMREIRAFEILREKHTTLLQQQSIKVQKAAKAGYYKRMGRVYYHHKISIIKALRYYVVAIFSHPTDFDTWAAFAGVVLPSGFRQWLHIAWNGIFGGTKLAIRSH